MSTDELRTFLANYNEARNEYLIAEQEMKDAERELIVHLFERQQKSATFTRDNGSKMQVTVVAGSTYKLDEDRLKKLLGTRTWNRYTVRKVVRSRIEEGISNGELDPIIVGQCASEVPKQVYLRVSEAPGEDA